MFKRDIIYELVKWMTNPNRKPLILRGARQVGKTTVIKQFAEKFDEFIYLNLELNDDRKVFTEFQNINKLVEAIFFIKNKVYSPEKKTLIFIDEIQFEPEAIKQMRYFKEQMPELFVIAAGSMLERVFNYETSFPVGRVEYLVLRPVSFTEFLNAMKETQSLEQLKNVPLENFAYDKLFDLYHKYALTGGMPEVVKYYSENQELTGIKNIYESLITSYIDDVEKYAKNDNQAEILRHTIKSVFSESGKRIKFHGFGNSNYGSREMGEALRALEKALIINIIYPCISNKLPVVQDKKKSPRLQFLDTGLMNYFLNIQQDILMTDDLHSVYKGTMIEHLTGQELLTMNYDTLSTLNFWVKEKNSSSAEIDYLYKYENKLIPIEVKSGSEGRLRSMHIYMDDAPHNIAVRFYSGKVQISEVYTTSDKKYFLLNLPYFLVSQIDEYLKWMEGVIIN